jgi:predicted acylesterase/phospholipase RssA
MNADLNNFTRLVLSGGGPRGMGILGALHYADEHKYLDNIQEYWGASVGSIISLLLLIEYTPFEAFHQFFMLEHFVDPNQFNLQSVLETSALCPIEVFGQKIRHFVEHKIGRDVNPTFMDLYKKYGKKIHIIGANTDTMSGECFDVDNNPDMKVIEAIEISCDLPYIFTRKNYNGHTYVDGGFINNYPINMADDGKENVLGICVFGDMNIGGDYISWIYRLLFMPIMELHRERISRLSNKCINVELKIDGVSITDMSPNQKKKISVFSTGYQQASKFFKDREEKMLKNAGDGWDIELSNDDYI